MKKRKKESSIKYLLEVDLSPRTTRPRAQRAPRRWTPRLGPVLCCVAGRVDTALTLDSRERVTLPCVWLCRQPAGTGQRCPEKCEVGPALWELEWVWVSSRRGLCEPLQWTRQGPCSPRALLGPGTMGSELTSDRSPHVVFAERLCSAGRPLGTPCALAPSVLPISPEVGGITAPFYR